MGEQTLHDTSVISMTPAAITKIKALMAEKQLEGYGLRIFVAGGGCSGLQYGMAFDNNPQEEDSITEVEGVKVFVDPVSLQYIRGSSVDFVDTLMSSGFRIDNPNAVATCGCGNSFRTAQSGAATRAARRTEGSCSCR